MNAFGKKEFGGANCNRLLGFIQRSIATKSSCINFAMYLTVVRSRLEFCVQFWKSRNQNELAALERAQRPATKMMKELVSI